MSSLVHSAPAPQDTQAEPPQGATPDSVSTPEIPITEVLRETGRPYLVKHLEASLAWDDFDQTTKENAELIEERFIKNVKSGKYRGDKVAYKDFLRHYENVTNTKHAPAVTKINLIAEFLRYSERKAKYES